MKRRLYYERSEAKWGGGLVERKAWGFSLNAKKERKKQATWGRVGI
jgi:hypothetical protein